MKKITLLLLSLFVTATVFAQVNPLEGRIDAALGESFATQQNQLEPIISELKADEAGAYWIAYAQFYSSVYYLQTGQKEKAAETAGEAISLLEAIKNETSEDHALLGYLLGYSTAFDPASAPRLSGKADKEYQAALEKNSQNMRAYLGMGESDFFKPASFGGGQKVEEYLLKALSLPEQTVENGPSWGKNAAYVTLATFYQREGQIDKAKMYCMQGLAKFPDDARLNQLKQSF